MSQDELRQGAADSKQTVAHRGTAEEPWGATRRKAIESIRRFNRCYVPVMRLLDQGYLNTGMSALEAVVLIEIGERDGCSARDVARELNMDKGYLSRTLRRFGDQGLIAKSTSAEDARVQALSLTAAGRERVVRLADSGAEVISEAFADASDAQLVEVATCMERVLEILGKEGGPCAS